MSLRVYKSLYMYIHIYLYTYIYPYTHTIHIHTYIYYTHKHTLHIVNLASESEKFEDYNFFTDNSKLRKYICRENVLEE